MNLTRDIQVAGPYKLGDVERVAIAVRRMMRVAVLSEVRSSTPSHLDCSSEALCIWDVGGKIAAVAAFTASSRTRMQLDLLFTDEPLRNRGLGRALLSRLTEVAKDRGFKRILLGTAINNAAMRHLAQRTGFVEDSINLAIELGKDAA